MCLLYLSVIQRVQIRGRLFQFHTSSIIFYLLIFGYYINFKLLSGLHIYHIYWLTFDSYPCVLLLRSYGFND